MNEPKTPVAKNAPKETPKPPRWGILLIWELLSLGLAVRFLMTLTYTIIGKVLYAAMKEHRKTTNDKIKMFSFKKIEIISINVLNVY
jgi:hypothetical protein